MRGGLDDALERLARRDRMRRRSGQQTGGPSPAVAELVEAVADVLGRNPDLQLTIGVEGAGSPQLLHIALEDGVVRVTAQDPVQAMPQRDDGTVAHFDFDADVDESPPADGPAEPRHAYEWSGGEQDLDPYDGGDDEIEQEPVASGRSAVLLAPSPYVPAPAPRPPVPPEQRPAHQPLQPLPPARPIPLQVKQPEETELAAKRLAALLREDPTLLQQPPG